MTGVESIGFEIAAQFGHISKNGHDNFGIDSKGVSEYRACEGGEKIPAGVESVFETVDENACDCCACVGNTEKPKWCRCGDSVESQTETLGLDMEIVWM